MATDSSQQAGDADVRVDDEVGQQPPAGDRGDGLTPRTEAARAIAGADRSGWRPFWDYEQESLDAAAISWTAETSVDGSLSTLYVQAPYGYQNDVLGAEESVVLSKIAESMRSNGHADWADVVDADRVSCVDWRSGDCQTFGLSYSAGRRPDAVKLTALSAADPYGIEAFGGEWLTAPTADEAAAASMKPAAAWPWVVGGMVFALSAGAIAGLITAAVIYAAESVVSGVKENHKLKKAYEEMHRPGYVLETTGGWLVWQYDWPTKGMTPDAKQKWLAGEARKQVDLWISRHYSGSVTPPRVVDTAVSSDGRLTWFRSSVPLTGAQCELSPYQAEQYLSLYVKHQKQAGSLPGREYVDSKPTVIMSTVGEVATPSGRPDAVDRGGWMADSEASRAVSAMSSDAGATGSQSMLGAQTREGGFSAPAVAVGLDTASVIGDSAVDSVLRLSQVADEVEAGARALMSKAVASQASQSVDATKIAAGALAAAGRAASEAKSLSIAGDAADSAAVCRLADSLDRWKASLDGASRLLDLAAAQASPMEALGLTATSGASSMAGVGDRGSEPGGDAAGSRVLPDADGASNATALGPGDTHAASKPSGVAGSASPTGNEPPSASPVNPFARAK